MSTKFSSSPRLRSARTYNRTPMQPDTRNDAEKARDAIPANHQARGRYLGGPGKPLLP